MRLSDVLARAPEATPMQVEGFLGDRNLGWGKHRKISIGRVLANYYCLNCRDQRSFASGDDLYCLGLGESSVSIDAALSCPGCGFSIEVWYLLVSDGDISGPAPVVRIEHFTENLRTHADRADAPTGEFADLMKCALRAHEAGLGAGSMIYVRQILESVTLRVAGIAEIPTMTKTGKRRPFKDVLQDVNERRQIIPRRFSSNGYQLFSELSEAIHGRVDEGDALRKFAPCLNLVRGIVEEVVRDEVFAAAIEELGWQINDPAGSDNA